MVSDGGQLPLPVVLDVEARFDTFSAGPNAALVAALRNIAAPGVWISGDAQSGRSHLLQAIVAAQPAGRAVYLPLKAIPASESIQGLPDGVIVCLDDVHTVAGVDAWERAIFLLYEQMLKTDGRLVVSAGNVVNESGFSLPDLASRLNALSTFRLRPPDDAGQVSALKKRADIRGLKLSDDAAQYMLRHLPRALSEQFEWLTILDHRSLAARRKLTLPFVRDVIGEAGAQLATAKAQLNLSR